MRTVRKRHRDAIHAIRLCRRAFKLALLFGTVAFALMALHILMPEISDINLSYSELIGNIVLISTCLYVFFLFAAIFVALFIYYLFKKHHLSTRMFRLKDLTKLLVIQFLVLVITAYITHFVMVSG